MFAAGPRPWAHRSRKHNSIIHRRGALSSPRLHLHNFAIIGFVWIIAAVSIPPHSPTGAPAWRERWANRRDCESRAFAHVMIPSNPQRGRSLRPYPFPFISVMRPHREGHLAVVVVYLLDFFFYTLYIQLSPMYNYHYGAYGRYGTYMEERGVRVENGLFGACWGQWWGEGWTVSRGKETC